MIVTEPLRLTETTESWAIDVTIDGGGVSGQAGAFRLASPGRCASSTPSCGPPEEGRIPHPRRPGEGVEEVRTEEGPQGAPVLQAVSRWSTRFGTDGVRGVANVELTPELALALGRAVARTITAATFLVGRDTRRSGPLLQAALSAGLASEGADVVDLGVLPTPTLAWLSATRAARRGHLGLAQPVRRQRHQAVRRRGAKLTAEMEAAIEDELERILDPTVKGPRGLEGHGVGR